MVAVGVKGFTVRIWTNSADNPNLSQAFSILKWIGGVATTAGFCAQNVSLRERLAASLFEYTPHSKIKIGQRKRSTGHDCSWYH